MNPVLLDFPSEFYTERLFIRMPMPGDGQVVFQAINESIEDLRRWMAFARKDQTEEEVEINIRKSYTEFLQREDLRLHIFLRETGEFIGSSGLHRINWSVPKFEIGYWINSRFSKKGYMKEAVEGIVNFALEELGAKRLEIRCDPRNTRSRAIPGKLGFKLEGILENDKVSADGATLRDTCIYARVIKSN
ncbi:GNAT family N-acetyltransferase [Listeria monocytogenes]|uniref:GNAT family N-acetyltransferase n=1 Tax=Priestia TaxID=2800373 RepID=UPI001ED03309|nr:MULTISPECIES: GNAT family N-acetyltransferase [Priestia]EGI2115001.1 GNAT family N-acetyltransferase [Listeria monocytogenes]MCU7712958.1 GNAT family N-acetyltransferase [Priestia megaterium]MCW1049042.1 GNAT family N-acetyltransferase [Priestia sp. JV24]MDN4634043.1 GNAT family N-acetyltransferase [Sphingomonas sp. PsM26]